MLRSATIISYQPHLAVMLESDRVKIYLPLLFAIHLNDLTNFLSHSYYDLALAADIAIKLLIQMTLWFSESFLTFIR